MNHALTERRTRVLVERLPLVTYTLLAEPPFPALYISPQIEPIFGFDAEECLGKSDYWTSRMAPEDLPRFRKALDRLAQTRDLMSVEYRMLAGDGRVVWVRDVGVVAREDDGAEYIHGYLADITREKELEAALEAERAQADAFFRDSPVGLGITDDAGRYLKVNDALARVNGRPPEEHVGRTIDRISPEIAPHVLPLLEEARRTGKAVRQREIQFEVGGQLHAALGSVFPIEFGGQTSYGRIVMDISKQRRAEAEIVRLIEQLPLVTYMTAFEPEYHTTYVSPQIVELFGYSVEEWLADVALWERIVHPEDQPIVRRAEAEARERHERFELEYRVVRSDGTVGWIFDRMETTYDTAGKPVGERGFLVDVTERRQSERMLSSVFENAFEAVVLIDENGRFVDANPAACTLFGASREEIAGSPLARFTEPGFDAEAAWQDFVATGEATGSTTIVRPDGSEHEVEYSAKAEVLPGRHLAVLRDVTDRKSLERELWRAQKLESVGRLAGGVAHDFNNMLTAIRGYAQLLGARVAEGSAESHHAGEIDRAAERAAALTAQLLALGRRQTLQPRVVDLNRLVEELDPMLRRLVGTGVSLVYELDPALCSARVDPAQIQQALLNLVTNAGDAMNGAGEVVIRTANAELAGRPDVAAGRYAVVSVEDTGTGIDEVAREHLFEPFFTTKDVGTGTGLGLAAAYGIARQSGGTIVVESTPGSGSTFSVYLPEATPEVAASPSAAPAGETVLVVEADPAVSDVVFEVLADGGYRVLTARTRADALRLAERVEGTIDVLVADLGEARTAGLARTLQDARPELRVVALEKPYTAERLRTAVRAAPKG